MVRTKTKSKKQCRESEHCEDYLWLMRSFTEEVDKEMRRLLKDIREAEYGSKPEGNQQDN